MLLGEKDYYEEFWVKAKTCAKKVTYRKLF